MNAQALPYTLLILLVEFTVGGLWVVWLAHLRGRSASSFIKFGAATVFVAAALTFWAAAKISIHNDVDGYPLDSSYMPAARIAQILVLAFSLPHAFLTLRASRFAALVARLA